MSSYLLSVIGMVLFCTVLTMAIPQGKTTTLVHAIARLACVLTILAPIPDYLWGENNLFFKENSIQADADFISYYSELRLKEAEKTLESGIEEKYDKEAIVTLYWSKEEDVIRIYEVGITGNFSVEERAEIMERIQDDYGVKTVFYDDD